MCCIRRPINPRILGLICPAIRILNDLWCVMWCGETDGTWSTRSLCTTRHTHHRLLFSHLSSSILNQALMAPFVARPSINDTNSYPPFHNPISDGIMDDVTVQGHHPRIHPPWKRSSALSHNSILLRAFRLISDIIPVSHLSRILYSKLSPASTK